MRRTHLILGVLTAGGAQSAPCPSFVFWSSSTEHGAASRPHRRRQVGGAIENPTGSSRIRISPSIRRLHSTTDSEICEETSRSVAATALQKSGKKKSANSAAQQLESLPAFANLAEQRDRSFARNLVATVERRMGQIDKILGLCADKYPPRGKHAPLVQAALRLGAAQLLFLDAPPHAAIKETVDLLKIKRPGQKLLPPEAMVKFVNAILRRIQREKDSLLAQTSSKDNVADWLVDEWIECWGEDSIDVIADQLMQEPHIDLSVNLGPQTSVSAAMEKLQNVANEFGDDALILPNNSMRVGRDMKGAVSNWPGYDQGEWWVQSAASTLPAIGLINALKDQHGGDASSFEDMHIVDCCAAPGGKTAQLLAAGFGRVTAIEANARRSRRLVENLERLQLTDNCEVVVSEGQEWLPSQSSDDIAGILVDVPCSATGTGMRRPDVLRRDSDLGNLPEVQEALLNHCADNLLKVGGVLVFATCSLLKRESEDQVSKLLQRGTMRTIPFVPGEIGGFDGAIDDNGWLRVLPGVMESPMNSVDGFFVARLQKIG